MWFCMGVVIVGCLWAGAAWGQEAAAPAVVSTAEVSPATPDASSLQPSFAEANVKATARLEAEKSKSLEDLKTLLKETEAKLPELAKISTERNTELTEARNKADREAPEIQALYKQIEDLQVKIAVQTDALPDVQGKRTAYMAAQSDLFETMQFRTKLMALISAKEAAEPTPEKETRTP